MQKLTSLAVAFLVALTCAAPFVVMLALPMFDGGIFRQTETVAVGLHVLACATACALMLLSASAPALLARSLTLPILAIMAMGLIGTLLLPWVADAAGSFNGSLENPTGVLWHLETALLAIGALVAWRASDRARVLIATSAAASVALCAVLQLAGLRHGAERLVPYDFPEYLGIDGMFAAVPLLALGRRWATSSAVVLVLATVALAANRSVALALVAAALLSWACGRWGRLRASLPALAVVLTLVVAGILAFAAPALETLAEATASSETATVLSKAPLDHVSIQTKPYGTVWDRSVSARVLVDDMLSHPIEFLVGSGYGSFERVTQVGERIAPGRRMVRPNDTASLAYWDGAQKARFHVHNALYEALLSGGVLLALTWLAFTYGVARDACRGNLLAGATLVSAVIVGMSLWFLVNAAAPLLAIAVASLTVPADRRVRIGAPAALGLTLGAVALTATTAAAAAIGSTAVSGERAERAYVPLLPMPNGAPLCQGYEALTLPNRQINRELYKVLVRRLVDEPSEEKVVDLAMHRANITNFSCLMRRYAARGDTLALLQSLQSRHDLVDMLGPGNPLTPSTVGTDLTKWQGDLDDLLSVAPGRTDLIIPFVEWMRNTHPAAETKAAAEHFVSVVRDGDPVLPWLRAQADQSDDRPDLYRAHIAQAFDQGLANVMVIQVAAAKAVLKAGK